MKTPTSFLIAVAALALCAFAPATSTKPTTSNTGHTTAIGSLTTHTGNYTTTSDFEVVSGLRITGQLNVQHDDVVVEDCLIEGIGSFHTLLISGSDVTVEDCTIEGFSRVTADSVQFDQIHLTDSYLWIDYGSTNAIVNTSLFTGAGGVSARGCDVAVSCCAFDTSAECLEVVSNGDISPWEPASMTVDGSWFDGGSYWASLSAMDTFGNGVVDIDFTNNVVGGTPSSGRKLTKAGDLTDITVTQSGNEDGSGNPYSF